jgi:dTDP-4-amino-4,6-dideoxygalactose transaminase
VGAKYNTKFMKVPFFSLEAVHQPLKHEFMEAFSRIVDDSSFILGKDVEQFESGFAAFCDSRFAIGVGNGLDALKIALKTLGIGPGDEVIVPAHTYIATWLAVSEVGAVPVPVDVCEDTMNINTAFIPEKISSKTKAIMPVHIYGLPCDMDAIMKMAKENNLYVVEDFAQAQGAAYKGKKAGSFGHINGCSFYPSKNIGAMGDAGAITTSDSELAQKAAMIRNYGSSQKYVHELEGINSRLDSFQAAVLNIKLPYLNKQNEERRNISAMYTSRLKEIKGIKLQIIPEDCESAYHLFTIRTERRDALKQYLQEHGVGSLIHYPIPPHLQSAYKHLNYQKGDFPVSEKIAQETLSLPLFTDLKKSDIDFINELILNYFE